VDIILNLLGVTCVLAVVYPASKNNATLKKPCLGNRHVKDKLKFFRYNFRKASTRAS